MMCSQGLLLSFLVYQGPSYNVAHGIGHDNLDVV